MLYNEIKTATFNELCFANTDEMNNWVLVALIDKMCKPGPQKACCSS